MEDPDSELFVHVRGTDESIRLSKEAIRQQILEGQMRRSQLIWSPVHQNWKQARELPDLFEQGTDEKEGEIFVHITGTEDSIPLPREQVRRQIADGQMRRSQLIWSPVHQNWKQVRELPELLPNQAVAPAPVVRRPTTPLPGAQAVPVAKVAVKAGTKGVAVPMVVAPGGAASPVQAGTAARAAAMRSKPRRAASRHAELAEEEEKRSSYLAWIATALAVVVLVVSAFNYFWVQVPLRAQLATTSFTKIFYFAHLGAFFQTDELVIHVPPTTTLNEGNLSMFIAQLAAATPPPPLRGGAYQGVTLTSRWAGQYTIEGSDWAHLATLVPTSEQDRREFLITHLSYLDGEPIFTGKSSMKEMDPQGYAKKEADAWETVVANFCLPAGHA